MTIGIAKIGKTIYIKDTTSDFASWSDEVIKIFNIFKKYGHDVYFITPTDQLNQSETDPLKSYDVIYVFAGVGSLELIQGLRDRTKDLRLIVTDLRFFDNTSMYDKIYTQSPEIGEFLLPIFIYYKWKKPLHWSPRSIKYYFGGGMRDRKKDFLEYVYRDECEYKAKIEIDHKIVDNRVGRNEHLKLLQNSRYSIVIADRSYNSCGFITMRHYENMMNGVISFVDEKYDPYETIIRKSDFRRVSSFEELQEKMDWLDSDISKRIRAAEMQYKEIKKEHVNGKYIYDKLI